MNYFRRKETYSYYLLYKANFPKFETKFFIEDVGNVLHELLVNLIIIKKNSFITSLFYFYNSFG